MKESNNLIQYLDSLTNTSQLFKELLRCLDDDHLSFDILKTINLKYEAHLRAISDANRSYIGSDSALISLAVDIFYKNNMAPQEPIIEII